MGQKVHPVGFRLGVYVPHKSVWFADRKSDFPKFLQQDFKIREYIRKSYDVASISDINIERKGERVFVVIHSARPGILIGKKGEELSLIKGEVKKILGGVVPSVVVEEVKKPDLVSSLVAQSIAKQIEKRAMFRKIMKKAIDSVRRSGGKGVKVQISGRLNGAEIARTEWEKFGSIPLHTLRSDVDYATAEALTTYGIIGVKVWIFKGELI